MASKTSNQRIVAPDPNSVTAAASHRSPLSATHSANRRRATATSDRKARRTSGTAYTPITASPRRSVISAPEHRRSSKEKGDHCSTSYGDLRLSKLKKELFPAEEVAAPKVKGDQIGTSCEGHQTSSRTLYPAQVISAPQGVNQDEKDQLSGNLADHMRGYSVGTTLNQLIEDPERRKEELGEFLKLLGMLYALTLDKEELEFETEFAQFLKSAD